MLDGRINANYLKSLIVYKFILILKVEKLSEQCTILFAPLIFPLLWLVRA